MFRISVLTKVTISCGKYLSRNQTRMRQIDINSTGNKLKPSILLATDVYVKAFYGGHFCFLELVQYSCFFISM